MAELLPGDPVPNWIAPSDANPRCSLPATGGRRILLGVLGSARASDAAAKIRTEKLKDPGGRGVAAIPA